MMAVDNMPKLLERRVIEWDDATSATDRASCKQTSDDGRLMRLSASEYD
jgi:hypothetical protein